MQKSDRLVEQLWMEYSFKIMLTKLFCKIISKEPYNDMNIFFSGFESFEEIPLISRRRRLKLLKKYGR